MSFLQNDDPNFFIEVYLLHDIIYVLHSEHTEALCSMEAIQVA